MGSHDASPPIKLSNLHISESDSDMETFHADGTNSSSAEANLKPHEAPKQVGIAKGKMFECPECEKSFKNVSKLNQHKAIHSGLVSWLPNVTKRVRNHLLVAIVEKDLFERNT